MQAQLPSPVAYLYSLIDNAAGESDRYKFLLRCYQAVVRYCAAVQISDYLANGGSDDGLTGRLLGLLPRKLSLGHWVELTREITRWQRRNPGRAFVPEMVEFYFRPGRGERLTPNAEFFERLCKERNEDAHGGQTPSPEAYEKRFWELKGPFDRLLEGLGFLADYPLYLPEWGPNFSTITKAYLLAGPAEAPPLKTGLNLRLSGDARERMHLKRTPLLVGRSDAGRQLLLSPLVASDGRAGARNVYLFNGCDAEGGVVRGLRYWNVRLDGDELVARPDSEDEHLLAHFRDWLARPQAPSGPAATDAAPGRPADEPAAPADPDGPTDAGGAGYAEFRARRRQLLDLLDRSLPVLRALDLAEWWEAAGRLRERINADRFCVAVLGEFKRGKSTLLNALLREPVLPTSDMPCTAVLTEVKWGAAGRALLHFRSPVPSPLPAGLPGEVRDHLERHGGGAPALVIDLADVKRFVAFPELADRQALLAAEAVYDRVEVFWPRGVSRDGVELIDTPGLNDHPARDRRAADYLGRADAVVFVMSVVMLGSESERAFLQCVCEAGHECVLLVCNHFDRVAGEDDREQVVQYAHDKLAGFTRLGKEGVYFVSALDALKGYVARDTARVRRSGIAPLERALERFLVEDRGRLKLSRYAAQLGQTVKAALFDKVPARRAALKNHVEEQRRRREEAAARLEQLAHRRDELLGEVDIWRGGLRNTVRGGALRFLNELAGRLPVWGDELRPKNRITPLMLWGREDELRRLADEVVTALGDRVRSAASRWAETELAQLLQGSARELPAELTRLGSGMADAVPGLGQIQSSDVSRGMLSGVALATFADVPLAALVSRPWLTTEQAKKELVQAATAQLRQEAPKMAEALASQVHDGTRHLAAALADDLERETRAVGEQLEAVTGAEAGEEERADRERRRLAAAESELQQIDAGLADLLTALPRPGPG